MSGLAGLVGLGLLSACQSPQGTDMAPRTDLGRGDLEGPDLRQPPDLAQDLSPVDLFRLPPPAVTGVSPASAPDSAATPITLAGTGFQDGATVTVGGQPCAGPTVTATQIGCTVPAQTPGCGLLSVVVHNPDGQSATLAKGFLFYPTGFLLSAGTTAAVGSGPRRALAGDFNGDGKLDLATVNPGSNDVSVLFGKGDGTSQAAASHPVGQQPNDIVAGDFNGDGKLDLITVNPGDPSYSVLLGQGDGTFALKTTALPQAEQFLSAGDLNGDGKLDLFLSPLEGNFTSALVLPGKGDGTFGTATPVGQSSPVQQQALADMNGDGKLDLVYTMDLINGVFVLLGQGNGTFSANTAGYSVGGTPLGLAVADFNGDGRLDAALTQNKADVASVLLGTSTGNGPFKAPVNTNVGTAPTGIFAADFNHDGHQDLIVANSGSGSVSYLQGKGDGTLAAAVNTTLVSGSAPAAVLGADLNGDGLLDVVSVNTGTNQIEVFLQKCQ